MYFYLFAWSVVDYAEVNYHVILKVDQHWRSCTRHRHQRGQMCCELWCTTVHQGIHSQVSCPTFSDTIRFTMNVCINFHCGLSVFRIGRTARAGKAGLAFTFLLRVQVKHFYIITYRWERQMIGINSKVKNKWNVPFSPSGEKLPPDGGGGRKPRDSKADH